MNKLRILEVIAGLSAIAENENTDLEDFLPLRDYAVLREPNKFLVLGGRGSGKTKVFKTLLYKNGFEQIIGSEAELFRPGADNSQFIAGYDISDKKFPSKAVLNQFSDEADIEAFWVGSVVILLCQNLNGNQYVQKLVNEYFCDAFIEKTLQSDKALSRPSEWIPYIRQNPEKWECFLDDVDEYLEENDKWLFFIYDYLDRIRAKYVDLFSYIRTLLAFWFEHLHRWKRIKCKIFLRTDLYDSELLNFPDSSKLASNVLKLEWSTPALYRLLIKRMANAGDKDTIEYLHLTKGLISEQPDNVLGYIPTESENLIEEFVNAMIGQYMGSGSKKGRSYTWVPNHLQDTHGVLSPRSFIKCYSEAAKNMCDRQDELAKLSKQRLLIPSMLQGAVLAVSKDRVKELQEEYPWLDKLERAFAGTTLLIEKKEFMKKITMDLWTDEEKQTLPATMPTGIFDALQKMGILFVAKDGRVNVPEIYLHGFGMKRKGGLRRPN